MISLKIKESHKHRVVGFNNSGGPIGERKDLLELAIIAREANDTFLLSFFEGEVPSLEKLREEKAAKWLPPVPMSKTTKQVSIKGSVPKMDNPPEPPEKKEDEK